MPHNIETGKATVRPEPETDPKLENGDPEDEVSDHLEPRGPAGWRLAGLLLFAAVIIALLVFQIL